MSPGTAILLFVIYALTKVKSFSTWNCFKLVIESSANAAPLSKLCFEVVLIHLCYKACLAEIRFSGFL